MRCVLSVELSSIPVSVIRSLRAAVRRLMVPTHEESDRYTITAQPDRCGEECRSDCQADPQPRAAQEMPGSEVGHRVHRHGTRRCDSFRATAHAVPQNGSEMRTVERHLLDDADREQWQAGP